MKKVFYSPLPFKRLKDQEIYIFEPESIFLKIKNVKSKTFVQ